MPSTRPTAAASSAGTAAAGPAAPTPSYSARLSAGRAFLLNAAFVAAMLILSQLPLLDDRPMVRTSILGAALVLLAWSALLFGVLRRGQTVTFELLPRRQHYLQACQQGLVLLVWGYYWREVYHAAPLILAQLLFAYGFESLLTWAHRRKFVLGFGPFPIVFSITLFFWFKDEWFYWQFGMVALGLLAKEFLRWKRDGQNTHIFNPSSFPLAVVGLVLLIAGTNDMTWGFDVAETQFYPPHMYLVIFLVALPGQFLFGVTTMTMTAIVTTFLFSAIYQAATGSFYFIDSHIPIAVFLGMHLLFTDPSTSPRTELGRIFFGVLYGLSTVLLYDLLLAANVPAFYDKLLQVPLLNLSVILIDRLARSPKLSLIDPSRLGRALAPRRRHLVWIGIWAAAFGSMSASGYIGDRHPGQWSPYWEKACEEGARNACLNLYFTQEDYCALGSGWACNETGLLLVREFDNPARADSAFQQACLLGFATGCANARSMAGGGELREGTPTEVDYRIVLRGSKDWVPDLERDELFERACELGWPEACGDNP